MMASFWSITFTTFATFSLLLTSQASFISSSPSHISLTPSPSPSSSLSPSQSPAFSPAGGGHYEELSPETTPLFPTPISGDGLPPSESSMPTIPASLSPPNPDAVNDTTFSPSVGGAAASDTGEAAGFSLPSANSAASYVDMRPKVVITAGLSSVFVAYVLNVFLH